MAIASSIAQNIASSIAQNIAQIDMSGGIVPVLNQYIITENNIMITSEIGINLIEG